MPQVEELNMGERSTRYQHRYTRGMLKNTTTTFSTCGLVFSEGSKKASTENTVQGIDSVKSESAVWGGVFIED
jgi:hypothetical protein